MTSLKSTSILDSILDLLLDLLPIAVDNQIESMLNSQGPNADGSCKLDL